MTPAERAALAEHLKVYAEMGVEGVSKDPRWRERAGDGGADVGRFGFQSAKGDGPSKPEGPYEQEAPLFASLEQVRAHIGDCTRCKLHKQGRKQVVFGVGNPNADLMFVGEAPGADEDQQGEPFVGKVGSPGTELEFAL